MRRGGRATHAIGRLTLLGLLSLANAAWAQVTPYEWVYQTGRNNLLDSNASSCDAVEGCYRRSGARCSPNTSDICDLQIVPAGRCTSGDLTTGEASCVWPHNAGRCVSNPKVGCLSDVFLASPILANAVTGFSTMCRNFVDATCDMTIDKFGDAQTPAEIVACQCQGTDPSSLGSFETTVCGGARAVCSDGDPDRDTGGYGWAEGAHLYLGMTAQSFAALGPSVNGSATPSTSPRYPLENPPAVFDPQRDAGTVGRTPAGAIHRLRATEARSASPLPAGFDIWVQRTHGDSFWNDPRFETVQTTATFNTSAILLACDPPLGWSTGDPVAPNVFCGAAAHDGLTLLFRRDITSAEAAANPACPPTCGTNLDLTTFESEALVAVWDQDENAGLQLALQSGDGTRAGANDVLSARRVTLARWLIDGDLRCRLGGWGNPAGFIGRCADGPTACIPGDPTNGDALCVGQGGICRACNGPIDPGNPDLENGLHNALGLPPGYSRHGRSELDLVAGQRLGLVAGAPVDVLVPVVLVGTTANAHAEFRDVAGEGPQPAFDVADLGPVFGGFGVGIGTGGTFLSGVTLPIGEPCCTGGVDVTWAAEQPGEADQATLVRTGDFGPGNDGIPGCLGDNALASNGAGACDQRLGAGAAGAKSDGAFNTGLDDGALFLASARFRMRNWPDPAYSQVSALALRDVDVIVSKSQDMLMKLNVSYCPIVGGTPRCGFVDPVDPCSSGEDDADGVPCAVDNCPTVANANQSDSDADGVGDVCDGCTSVSNPRVAAGFLLTNPWATLTGGQRDDDHDGYGNKCDAKFPGVGGTLVGSGDLAQLRASMARSRTGDTCGTTGTRACAIFDLDESGVLIGAADLARFRVLNGRAPGPRCPTCPLVCDAGAQGSCF